MQFISLAGCVRTSLPARFACLRQAPLEVLSNASTRATTASAAIFSKPPHFIWSPSVDGSLISSPPQRLRRDGLLPSRRVPLLAGVNSNEGATFTYPFLPRYGLAVRTRVFLLCCAFTHSLRIYSTSALRDPSVGSTPLDTTGYVAHLRQLISNIQAQRVDGGAPRPANETVVKQALALYPPATGAGADSRHVLSTVLTDLTFHCSTRAIVRALASPATSLRAAEPTAATESAATISANNVTAATYLHLNASATYLYRFDIRAKDDASPAAWGVSHGSDVPFAFDHGDWVGTNTSFTPQEEEAATWIGDVWARFASGGSPLAADRHHNAKTPPRESWSRAKDVQPAAGSRLEDVAWPAYDPAVDAQAVLTDGPEHVHLETSVRAAACDFWRSLGWFI